VRDAEQELRAIDAATLTPLVRAARCDDRLEVEEWTFEPFGHSLDDVYRLARSILRFRGTARGAAAGSSVRWSLVLKIVRAGPTPDDPSSPDNGAREPLAYRSGLLDSTSDFAAPRCFGTSDRPGGGWWLWLEEVVDGIGREWPADRYILAARHLARFNVSHPAAAPTVSCPWLSRSPLREAVREHAPMVARLPGMLDQPPVGEAVTPAAAQRILAMLKRSDAWLDRLDELPQALCHWDAHRANLFSRTAPDGQQQTVAIDWAGVGWGPLGADLSKLLSQTVNFFGLDATALPALDAALFDHYLDGLHQAGWRGDRRHVRFGYSAACALRLIVRTATALRIASDGHARGSFEQATGQPFSSLAQRFAVTLPYYLSLADEAERLF
jgi:hypothetical protein